MEGEKPCISRIMPTTTKGQPVEVHYIGVFDQHQKPIGNALKLPTSAKLELQIVGDKVGFQLFMPPEMQEVEIVLSRPEIVGIALYDAQKRFLSSFSIPGDPTQRKEGDIFTLRSRYIILGPTKKPS